MLEESVIVISANTDAIGKAAKEANMIVFIIVNEGDGGTICNTQLVFDANGILSQRRRKLIPTYHEKITLAQVDAADLGTIDNAVCRNDFEPRKVYGNHKHWGTKRLCMFSRIFSNTTHSASSP